MSSSFEQLRGLRRFRRGDELLHLVGGLPRRSLELVEEVLPRHHAARQLSIGGRIRLFVCRGRQHSHQRREALHAYIAAVRSGAPLCGARRFHGGGHRRLFRRRLSGARGRETAAIISGTEAAQPRRERRHHLRCAGNPAPPCAPRAPQAGDDRDRHQRRGAADPRRRVRAQPRGDRGSAPPAGSCHRHREHPGCRALAGGVAAGAAGDVREANRALQRARHRQRGAARPDADRSVRAQPRGAPGASRAVLLRRLSPERARLRCVGGAGCRRPSPHSCANAPAFLPETTAEMRSLLCRKA